MDILQYFHLNEHPFRIGPDPRFLYLSDQVKEAIAKCEYMARERIGPIYIYGPIGAGKTSLLRRLYERLGQDDKYNLTLLISPNVKSSNAFLRMVMEAYDVKTERSYDQSLKNFEEFLIREYKAGRIPLLLVDEAQNLTRDVLKLVHYLLNFETATTKLLHRARRPGGAGRPDRPLPGARLADVPDRHQRDVTPGARADDPLPLDGRRRQGAAVRQ